MKKIIIALLTLFSGVFTASAQSPIDFDSVKKDGDIIQEKLIDLDSDGISEKVILKAYCIEFYEDELISYAGRLAVLKKSGASYKTIWEGPEIDKSKLHTEKKFRFFFGQGGFEPIELIGDIYGDKVIRIFSPDAKSDLSPAFYRVYAWKDNKFEFEQSGYLFEDAKSAGNFKWRDNKEKGLLCVLNFNKFEIPETVEASLYTYEEENGPGGSAILKINKDGLSIIKWLEKTKKD